MITYGFSVRGKSHVTSNTVCQDSNKTGRLKSGYFMGIVADGVGSAAHSEIGSSLAVNSLYAYCNEYIKRTSKTEDIESVMRAGYEYAMNQIQQYVEKNQGSIQEYDTTLSAVVYDGNSLVYGHAGDGGIIVRCQNGKSKTITQRQKGADGRSVRPLRSGSASWEFGNISDEGIVAVLLVTDGMLDEVIQPVLINLPGSRMALAKNQFSRDKVYVTVTEFFMNPYSVYLNRNVKDPDSLMAHFLSGDLENKDQNIFLDCVVNGYKHMLNTSAVDLIRKSIEQYHYAVWALNEVSDDKSVVAIINEKGKVSSAEEKYYKEPDWNERKKRYTELLYGSGSSVNVVDPIDKQQEPKPRDEIKDDKIPPKKENIAHNTVPIPKTGVSPVDQKSSRGQHISILMGLVIGILGLGLLSGWIGYHQGGKKERNESIMQQNRDKEQIENLQTKLNEINESYRREMKIHINNIWEKLAVMNGAKGTIEQLDEFWSNTEQLGIKDTFQRLAQENTDSAITVTGAAISSEQQKNYQELDQINQDMSELLQNSNIEDRWSVMFDDEYGNLTHKKKRRICRVLRGLNERLKQNDGGTL